MAFASRGDMQTGTQSEKDSAPEHTWSSIHTTEYNRTYGTIVPVSKQ